jgi:hypothetical protein
MNAGGQGQSNGDWYDQRGILPEAVVGSCARLCLLGTRLDTENHTHILLVPTDPSGDLSNDSPCVPSLLSSKIN